MILKQKNNLPITAYCIAQILIFCLLTTLFDFSSLNFDDLAKPGLVSLLSMVLTVILAGLLPDHVKSVLVFWKIKNPLPGCEAFTKHMHKDARIDADTLVAAIGNLPIKPEQQNKLWYRIYKKHADDPVILQSHKDYLLTRDITQISFLFLIFFGIGSFIVIDRYQFALSYSFFLLLIYVLTSIAARNYGVRFVNNVLALEAVARNRTT